ncbi:MAG: hypothetical protein J1E63_09325 [Muribaculaceae bacterium]|nr:hypothetical protein [Muribaculaceae bacterium]
MKLTHLLTIITISLLALSACKTTEANYRAAYESAVAGRQGSSPLEGTIYNQFRQNATTRQFRVGNDTIGVRFENIGFPSDGGATRDDMLHYNIVVGGFKQIFNAKAMRDRLNDTGDYNAFVVNTREPLYYVVAFTTDSLELAGQHLDTILQSPPFPMRDGYPFILQPTHLR